jgi:hypothetical protein
LVNLGEKLMLVGCWKLPCCFGNGWIPDVSTVPTTNPLKVTWGSNYSP